MKKQFFEIGKVVGTHGVRGELRVQPWCDSPDYLTHFRKFYQDGNGSGVLKAVTVRVHKNLALLAVEGIDSIESAEGLRDRTLYVARRDAPLQKGSYFIADLIGCAVFERATGEKLGTLSDVSRTGANDVWHITAENGREYLIPAIPDVVDKVDVDHGKIEITPLKGIFDEHED